MYSLINSNFNRTYNPSGRQNALTDIKRLLTSRDTETQNKACGYLLEVIKRHNINSEERARLVEYLLENDITVFLCEATSNLDFGLFRSILTCLRLLFASRFFSCSHAAQAGSAVLRALAHYVGSDCRIAVDACLHFLCDLFNGISTHGTTSPLSHQSAFSADQILACLKSLAPLINTNPNTILSSALMLHSLLCNQPDNLDIRISTAVSLIEVLNQWFGLLVGALNHSMLMGDGVASGMFLVVICQLGMDVLGLTKILSRGKPSKDLVQSILVDEGEVDKLRQCANEMRNTINKIITELVVFIKENQTQMDTEEYGVFLKFLLNYLYDIEKSVIAMDFCDVLFSKGYLTMLPQVQIIRNDVTVRKVSTLVLGEMLKALSNKYLNINQTGTNNETCAKDIHMGLVELQYGIDKPQSIGMELQKSQPYSILIYIYFYCQSSENPEESTAPLLPFLVEHILRLPQGFKPPAYIIKALWLVFAMSTISNGSIQSLDQRVYLEKATERLVSMLNPVPSMYYTHNPAILLWAFTSHRIPNYVRIHVLSQWLQTEDSLPANLSSEPTIWELLLSILVQNKDKQIITNCMEAIKVCLEEGTDEAKHEFAKFVWSMLPGVLSKALIDDSDIESNICYLLDISTTLLPLELDQTICLKIAVLITAIFTKSSENAEMLEARYHYEFVCLKLALYLLGLSNNQDDNRVLLTYVNRPGFLSSVLSSTNSADERVACVGLQLLSYVVHYFTKNKYQAKSILQIRTDLIIKSLRQDSSNERGASLLQLIYMVLNTVNAPLVLSLEPSKEMQSNVLRALMFRVQVMLCCRESKNQSLAGWKTLSAIFKHAIVTKNDLKLVATLTSQPWTHTLIQFTITQNITSEFLTFIQNWITLLKITIKKNQEQKSVQMSKQSLVYKTLAIMRKNLLTQDGETKELAQKILGSVKEIFDVSGLRC